MDCSIRMRGRVISGISSEMAHIVEQYNLINVSNNSSTNQTNFDRVQQRLNVDPSLHWTAEQIYYLFIGYADSSDIEYAVRELCKVSSRDYESAIYTLNLIITNFSMISL